VKDTIYFKQAELLLRILPYVDREAVFAMKGGTAINFFVRDLPRISVDIDLVYLPIKEREPSLQEISDALGRIARQTEARIPGTRVTLKRIRGLDMTAGLLVQGPEAAIKIEPNLVLRGTIYPPEYRAMTAKAREAFEVMVTCRTLAEDELYAGKICAALDRQHPRDLFDILVLLRDAKFTLAMRKAFVVYLVSHDRPIVELLNPGFVDIRSVYETEFRPMTSENVQVADLERAREDLISLIGQELTLQEKQFIVSVKEGTPQWELLGLEGIENLPAVKWKLLNIAKMSKAKHQQAVKKLKDHLKV